MLSLNTRNYIAPTEITAITVPTVRVRSLRPGATVYWEGDPSEEVFEVVTGMVRLCKLTADGRRQVTDFAYPGQLLGLARDGAYIHTADVITPCEIRHHRVASLLHRIEFEPQLVQRFLTMAMTDLLAAQERFLLLGRKTALERVACFIVELSQRGTRSGGSTDLIDVPMTRADIGDYLGLTIETTSRKFSRLKEMGVIRLDGANRLEILDHTRLLEMSDDESSVSLH